MNKIIKTLLTTFVALLFTAGTVLAINITVPSAPSGNYYLRSTTTGAYVPIQFVPLFSGSSFTIATTSTSTIFTIPKNLSAFTNDASFLSTTSGNWAGTWQLYNPVDFLSSSTSYVASESDPIWMAASSSYYLASNPSGYLSSAVQSVTSSADIVPSAISGSNVYFDFASQNISQFTNDSGYATSGQSLSGGEANYLPIWLTSSTLGTSTIYQSSGNVGIGTTTPSEKLDIIGNSQVTGGYYLNDVTSYVGQSTAGRIQLYPAGSEALRVDSSNIQAISRTFLTNVGTSATTPAYAFTSNVGSGAGVFQSGTGSVRGIGLAVNGLGALTIASTTDATFLASVTIGNATSSFLAVDPNGKIIATTTPSGSGSGTVTSVALTVPTGLTASGTPITTSGTLGIGLQSGYVIPLSASTTDWQTAFSWGNHASAGYLATTSGNWAGTWQLYNPVDFISSSTIIDISDQTNLTVGAGGLVLSGDSIDLDAGYTIPDDASIADWNTAYGWGDHSGIGYLQSGNDLNDVNSTSTSFKNLTFIPSRNGQLIMASSTDWVLGDLVSGTNISLTTSTPAQISIGTSLTPTFTTLSTGLGQYELYEMDQNVKTTSNVTFANATTTLLHSTTLEDANGYKQKENLKHDNFIIEYPTASEDLYITTVRSTSTLREVRAVNKTAGDTVSFNLYYDTNRSGTGTYRAFSGSQVLTATTTPTTYTSFASSTIPAGGVLRLITTAASSTQFGISLYYDEQ